MKAVRPFSKGTRQYLTFIGPPYYRIHPIVRSASTSFLGARYPKFVAINHNQQAAYRKAVA